MRNDFRWFADVEVDYPENVTLSPMVRKVLTDALDGRIPIFGVAAKAPRLIIKLCVHGEDTAEAEGLAKALVSSAIGQAGLDGFIVEGCTAREISAVEAELADFKDRFDFMTGKLRPQADIIPINRPKND